MSLDIAKRVALINPSATVGMIDKISELKAQGKDIIAFNVGEPDFNTADHINEAMFEAVRAGHTKYVNTNGIIELREAISRKFKRENNIEYKASQIVVSTGAKQALYNILLTIAQEGDEVIIPTPCWASYEELVKLVDAKCIFVETKDDFQLDVEAIEKAITTKTKAIIITTPNNPTGSVYDKESLKAVADLAIKSDFYIISDEIYEKLIYDGQKHVSMASLSQGAYEHTITVNGFAKAYAMTGHRIGYAAFPNDKLAKASSKIQAHTTSNSTTFVQYAAIEALESDQSFVDEMVKEFEKRRNLSFKLLDDIDNIKYSKVNGAFYIMIDVSYYFGKKYGDLIIKDVNDLSMYLLEEGLIALVPGSAFQAPNCLRFSYSNSQENIEKGLKRMKEALSKLK